MKRRNRIKTKNIILKTVTTIAVLVLWFGLSTADFEYLGRTFMLIGLPMAWIMLFCYANNMTV